jgi:hypothetical protein
LAQAQQEKVAEGSRKRARQQQQKHVRFPFFLSFFRFNLIFDMYLSSD